MQAWLQGVGWVSENDWYRKGETVASKSLWKMRRGGHSAWLGKEKKWAHWVILALFPAPWIEKLSPGSMHHSWASEQNPSLFPSETYLWRATLLPVRYSPADVPWEPRPAALPLLNVQEWAFCTWLGWKWHLLLWSPLGLPSGQNFLYRRGAVGSGCMCNFVLFLCEFA